MESSTRTEPAGAHCPSPVPCVCRLGESAAGKDAGESITGMGLCFSFITVPWSHSVSSVTTSPQSTICVRIRHMEEKHQRNQTPEGQVGAHHSQAQEQLYGSFLRAVEREHQGADLNKADLCAYHPSAEEQLSRQLPRAMAGEHQGAYLDEGQVCAYHPSTQEPLYGSFLRALAGKH